MTKTVKQLFTIKCLKEIRKWMLLSSGNKKQKHKQEKKQECGTASSDDEVRMAEIQRKDGRSLALQHSK